MYITCELLFVLLLYQASLSPCPIPGENDLEKVLYDSNASVVMEDLLKAAKSIQPTAKREGFAVAPNVTWADVGALVEVREELLHNVLDPIANPERYSLTLVICHLNMFSRNYL